MLEWTISETKPNGVDCVNGLEPNENGNVAIDALFAGKERSSQVIPDEENQAALTKDQRDLLCLTTNVTMLVNGCMDV